MTKRTSKHPRRSSRPPSPKAKPPPEHSLLRLLQRIPGVILKTGGLAAAIGAVIGLVVTILPSPSPKNVARFISVQTLSQIPLNQYQQRSAAFAEQSAYYTHAQHRGLPRPFRGKHWPHLMGRTSRPLPRHSRDRDNASGGHTFARQPGVAHQPGVADGRGVIYWHAFRDCNGFPANPVSPTDTVSPSGAASPTRTALPGGGIRILLPPGLSSRSARQFAEQVLVAIGERDPVCNMCRPYMDELNAHPGLAGVQKVLLPFAITAIGQLVSPTVAASRIVGILSNTRTATGDRKVPTCATRDIAAVAARLLLDPSWSGQASVPVLGPEDLSGDDMAQIMSEVLGKPVRFQQVPVEGFRAMLTGHGMSEAMAQGMVDMMVAKNEGLDNAEPRTPQSTTPTSFRQWCEEVLKPAILA